MEENDSEPNPPKLKLSLGKPKAPDGNADSNASEAPVKPASEQAHVPPAITIKPDSANVKSTDSPAPPRLAPKLTKPGEPLPVKLTPPTSPTLSQPPKLSSPALSQPQKLPNKPPQSTEKPPVSIPKLQPKP